MPQEMPANFSKTSAPQDKNKRVTALLIVVVLVAAALVCYRYFVLPARHPLISIPMKLLPPASVPAGFPKDFPIEPGATLMGGYNSHPSADVIEAGRIFTLKNSYADASYQFYKNYLQTNGWKIIYAGMSQSPLNNLPQDIAIVAQKANDTVHVDTAWNKAAPTSTAVYIVNYEKK